MRKVLLATTALVGVAIAGGAQAAAPSPISLNVGGYADFVAGFYHEAQSTAATANGGRSSRDFETEFKLSFDAVGKAANGVEYGANVSLWNGSEAGNLWVGGGTTAAVNSAYVWLSGAFGKVLFGDEHGASDLFVYAPTVGEGQVDGRFRDFVDAHTLAFFQASGVDNTEHSTKITYYTPKVGNEDHKVQLGVSYAPNLYDYGQNVKAYDGTTTATTGTSPYKDVIELDAQYTGNFHPVAVTASAQLVTGTAGTNAATTLNLANANNFTAWALGAQAACNGFTVGASYADNGKYNTVIGQGKNQDVWTFGGKYEFDKVAVGVSYLTGEGYANYLTNAAGTATATYVDSFNAYSAGATYTWFPGLTSNVDGVLFNQKSNLAAGTNRNEGYVFLVSQKLAF